MLQTDHSPSVPTTGELIESMTHLDAYPSGTRGPIDVLHTHTSVLFFTRNHVYKVKKPVDFGFLDFTTLARRRFFCEEEVRLNRRLTDIHLGVVPIRTTASGLRIEAEEGAVVEWAVKMVRLPESRMLAELLRRGEVDNGIMHELAVLVADFHRSCATGEGVDSWGEMETVLGNHVENVEQTRDFIGETISESQHQLIDRRMRMALDARAELIARRVERGRIRDGHGDLHAANICVLEEPKHEIVVYDCIEFTPRFRCADVAADIAFLAMDLDFRGFRGFSRYFVREYATLTHDPGLVDLMRYYKSYRACVRGKVSSFQTRDASATPASRARAAAQAQEYFQLAASYWLEPVVVVMCGLPGVGKSWLARELARPFEAHILRSDLVRKRLVGLQPTDHRPAEFEEGVYRPEVSDDTYAELAVQMEHAVSHGRSVIVDASFSSDARRRAMIQAATAAGARCVIVHVTCDDEVVRGRLAIRAQDPDRVSDAGVEVYEQAQATFESPSAFDLPWLEIPSGGEPLAARSKLIDALIESSPPTG